MGVCALTHTLAHALHKMLPPSPPWPEVNSKAYDSHYGQVHGKERERKKRKKKHTQRPDGGAPAATPYTPRHTLHISKVLRGNSGLPLSTATGVCTHLPNQLYYAGGRVLVNFCSPVCHSAQTPRVDGKKAVGDRCRFRPELGRFLDM